MTLISTKASHRGAQGEHLFEGHFLQNGIFIAAPKHDLHRVDYVVEWEGQLVRVNVKTLYRNTPTGPEVYAATTATSCSGGARRYTPDEIDYFGIVSLEYERIWMVPLTAVKGKTVMWHPPHKSHRKRRDSFDWAPYLIKWVDNTNLLKLS